MKDNGTRLVAGRLAPSPFDDEWEEGQESVDEQSADLPFSETDDDAVYDLDDAYDYVVFRKV